MNTKKLGIWSAALLGASVVLSLLANILAEAQFLSALYTIANPLLLIAAVVCGYFVFKDTVTFGSKALWAVIGIACGLALQALNAVFFGIFVSKAPVAEILAALFYTAGFTTVVLSLLDKRFANLLIAGFGGLVLGAVFHAGTGSFPVAEILLYGALVVMERKFIPNHNYLLRIAAIVLALLSISSVTLPGAVCWIIFTFILVPVGTGGKFSFTFKQFTAVLCALTAVVCLVAYAGNNPAATIDSKNERISQLKTEIIAKEENLAALQEKLTSLKNDLVTKQADLVAANNALEEAKTAHAELEAALAQAEANLDAVCTRSYYNSWYCTAGCQSLHTAVSNSSSALQEHNTVIQECESAVSSVQYDITDLTGQVESTEADITYTEESIQQLNEQVKSLQDSISVDYLVLLVNFIALALGVAALGTITYSFFANKDAKLTLAACGALALGALLHLLTGMVGSSVWSAPASAYILVSPHLWTLLTVACLTVILTKTSKPVTFRVLAIIAAVLLGIFAAAFRFQLTYLLYVATLICIALVLVPPVFTEYNTIAKHIFFTLISCGIWQLIWTYHVTKNLNKVAATEERKPALELVLCLFLPFYYSFWLLKTAENVEAYGAENGKPFKLDILCLVFAFLCPLVSTVLIQNKINYIVGKPE